MECREYFKQWKDSDRVDIGEVFSELIILTASRTLMGKEIRENLFKQVASLYHMLDKGLTPISFFYPSFPIPAHWRRDKARLEMARLFGTIIDARRADPDRREDDMLQILLEATYSECK